MKTSFKQKYIFAHLVSIMLLCRGILIALILFKISQTFWIVKIKTQCTFWYFNDTGVTSPSISLWNYRCIANETHDGVNFRYQPDIKILRLDQWNFISSWHRCDKGRYLAERNPPGSYTCSVSATIMPRLYCRNWKIRASGDFFSVAATKNMYFFSKQRYST